MRRLAKPRLYTPTSRVHESWHRNAFLVVLAIATSILRASLAHADSYDDHVNNANVLANEQKFSEAAREFEAAYRLKKQPDLALNLGRLYLKLKKGDAAQRYCALYLTEEFEPPADRKAKAVDCVTQAKRMASSKRVNALAHPSAVAPEKPQQPLDPSAPPLAQTIPPTATSLPPTPRATGSGNDSGGLASPPSGNQVTVASPPEPGTGTRVATLGSSKTAVEPTSEVPPQFHEPTALPPPVVPTTTVPTIPTEPVLIPHKPATQPNPILAAVPPPTSMAHGTPEHKPVYKRWWFWTLIGVGAAGAAAGITAGVLHSRATEQMQPPVDSLADVPADNQRTVWLLP